MAIFSTATHSRQKRRSATEAPGDAGPLAARHAPELLALLAELTRAARLATKLTQATHRVQQEAIRALAARDA